MIRTMILLPGKYVFVLLLVFLFGNSAFALAPEIHSVVPDRGANDSPTNITVYGANFEATPRVGFYGGGPYIVGSAITPGGFANGVYVSGNYAYVANWDNFIVINVSDPENPTIVGSAGTGAAYGVYVSGDYVYVADRWSGLQVLRIFDPCTNITVVNSTTLTATVPAGLPVGTYDLHVVNPNGERAVLHNFFLINTGITQNPDNGHWYQRFDDSMTWQDAKAQCETLGGYLATLTSQDENDFVYNNLVIPANNY